MRIVSMTSLLILGIPLSRATGIKFFKMSNAKHSQNFRPFIGFLKVNFFKNALARDNQTNVINY